MKNIFLPTLWLVILVAAQLDQNNRRDHRVEAAGLAKYRASLKNSSSDTLDRAHDALRKRQSGTAPLAGATVVSTVVVTSIQTVTQPCQSADVSRATVTVTVTVPTTVTAAGASSVCPTQSVCPAQITCPTQSACPPQSVCPTLVTVSVPSFCPTPTAEAQTVTSISISVPATCPAVITETSFGSTTVSTTFTAIATVAQGVSTVGVQTTSTPTNCESTRLPTGTIAGISVGALVGAAILLLLGSVLGHLTKKGRSGRPPNRIPPWHDLCGSRHEINDNCPAYSSHVSHASHGSHEMSPMLGAPYYPRIAEVP